MTDSRQTIIFYGNCQAGALSAIFKSHPKIAERFVIRHLPSFDDPVNQAPQLEPDEVGRAAILFEQHDPVSFPMRAALPHDCPTVTFPSIDFNLLWPLTRDNPYNDRSNPAIPWGEFPYGDRLIIDSVEKGLSPPEIVAHYESTSEKYLPDLTRFSKLERGRLAARDAKCDVKIADFVFATFRESFLFWCVNHPTTKALVEIGRRLYAAAGGANSPLGDIAVEESDMARLAQEPLALINVPVHPLVAKHFELTWYDGIGDTYGLHGANLSYWEYFTRMAQAAASVRARAQADVGTAH